MLVIKFGGTSVASAERITLVKNIISAKQTPIVVVVSALGGITNQLIEGGDLAKSGDETYIKVFDQIEQRHIETIKELVSVRAQSKTFSKIKILLNELGQSCQLN